MSIKLADLASRAARKAATGGGGIRRFATSSTATTGGGSGGGIVERAFSAVASFGSSLVSRIIEKVVGPISFTWGKAWGLFVSLKQFIWHFNWNLSDDQAEKDVKALLRTLASSLGGTLGNAVGWLACGILPSAVIFAFNEPLGLYALKNVSEEALDEISDNVAALIRQTFTNGFKAFLTWSYISLRKLWRTPDSQFRKQLEASGNLKKDAIDKAMADRAKPWSFATASESAIESIPNDYLKSFAEEFFEEADEACIEAGFVVANSVDSFLVAQKLAQQSALGSERTVEILLDRQLA